MQIVRLSQNLDFFEKKNLTNLITEMIKIIYKYIFTYFSQIFMYLCKTYIEVSEKNQICLNVYFKTSFWSSTKSFGHLYSFKFEH